MRWPSFLLFFSLLQQSEVTVHGSLSILLPHAWRRCIFPVRRVNGVRCRERVGSGRTRVRRPIRYLRRIPRLLSRPEAPPKTCQECALQYYRPSAAPPDTSPAPPARPEAGAPSKTPSDVPVSAVPGRSHLSSDPRVKTARVLVQRERFAQALKILRPLAASDHPDQTDVRFLMGLGASRGSQSSGLEDEIRPRAPGRSHLGVPVHPDPAAGTGARAPGTGPGLLFEGGGRPGPRSFRAGPGGPAACGPGREHQRVFEHHAGPAPLARGISGSPLHRIPISMPRRTRSSSISTACRSGGARKDKPVPLSAWWAGAVANINFPWPPAGACARASTSTTVNTTGTGSTKRTWVATWGRAG